MIGLTLTAPVGGFRAVCLTCRHALSGTYALRSHALHALHDHSEAVHP